MGISMYRLPSNWTTAPVNNEPGCLQEPWHNHNEQKMNTHAQKMETDVCWKEKFASYRQKDWKLNLAALEASENILTSNINNRKNIYFGFSFVLKMGDAI